MNQKKQFTLIELLVVIAIIAVLATMLFPVVGSMKEKAMQSTCLNNMSQMGKALLLYSNDNGSLPYYESTKDGKETHAHNFIWLRLTKDARDSGIYICPSCTETTNAAKAIEANEGEDTYKSFTNLNTFLSGEKCGSDITRTSSFCYFTGAEKAKSIGTMKTGSGIISDGSFGATPTDTKGGQDSYSWNHDDNGRWLRVDNSVQSANTTSDAAGSRWADKVKGNPYSGGTKGYGTFVLGAAASGD